GPQVAFGTVSGGWPPLEGGAADATADSSAYERTMNNVGALPGPRSNRIFITPPGIGTPSHRHCFFAPQCDGRQPALPCQLDKGRRTKNPGIAMEPSAHPGLEPSLILFARRRRAFRVGPDAVCKFEHQEPVVLTRRP